MFGFLIAIAAGAVAPMLERPVARPMAQALGDTLAVKDTELGTLAFIIALGIAGVLCAVFSTGTPLSLAIGGGLGFFGSRVLRWLKRIVDAKRD